MTQDSAKTTKTNQKPRKSNNNRYRKKPNSGQGARNSNRKPNNRRRNNNNGSKIKLDPLFRRYFLVRDELIMARKKYFESFYRADKNRMVKLERIYQQKAQEYSNFEKQLKPEDMKKLDTIFPNLKNDVTYSENRNLDLTHQPEVDKNLIEDPHFLEAQKSTQHKEDTEESTGTMDDYQAYKGL